jgi:hypothetical protein
MTYFETIYTKGKHLKKLIEIEVEWDVRLWIELMYLSLGTNDWLLRR